MSFEADGRVNMIWLHPVYQEEYLLLQECEKTREFCGHPLEHFLDVGRLMWIYNLEAGSCLDKELIYAAALLHDIGRAKQYREGIPHDEAGMELARQILPACAFTEEETEQILSAIAGHRQSKGTEQRGLLAQYLYRADKACRNCMICPVEKECNWAPEKKNMRIKE